MSYIISIYSQVAFKEFLLPAINNADSSIVLYKNIFQLIEDITLSLEVMNHKWSIPPNADYIVKKGTDNYFNRILCHKDVLTIVTADGRNLSMLINEKEDSFGAFTKFDIRNKKNISIGSGKQNQIQYSHLGLVSKEHAILKFQGASCILNDLSSNGVFVNEKRAAKEQLIQFGDCINILGLQLVYLGDILAVDINVETLWVDNSYLVPLEKRQMAYMLSSYKAVHAVRRSQVFHRVPRNIELIEEGSIEIEAPPKLAKASEKPMWMVIGPSMTMALPMLLGALLAIYSANANTGSSSMFLYTGLVTAVTSAVIGTFWGILNVRRQKRENDLNESERYKAYVEYLNQCTTQIEEKYNKNKTALIRMYPSGASCSLYDERSLLLWNRNNSHKDYLYERLGIGALPFQADIVIPKKKFTVQKDQLEEQPERIQKHFCTLQEVPVGIDLSKQKLVGIIGGQEKSGSYQVARGLLTQIGANNCYTDVKLAVIYDRSNSMEAEIFNAVKWLPHAWSEDKKVRYVADCAESRSDVFYELTKVLRQRAENKQETRLNKPKAPKPYYILFITDPKFLEGELIAKYILQPKEEYGLCTFLLVERYEELPNVCERIIENDELFQGVYSLGAKEDFQQSIQFDNVEQQQFDRFARNLAHIEVSEIETGGEIPNTLSYLEMYNEKQVCDLQVENRWKKNRTYESMKALIGQKSGGAPCYLDIHEKYHGPHGLVAGTTGSGKSEILQTYILSLAINYSPEDIGFFIIDYKGGGMSNLFQKLPHMVGQISNLSGNQVRRAMVSIKSENRRRQRIFNEHGVNSINQYVRLYKNNEAAVPIQHLFIIIDEFAELKREEPDFMRELISVAQVGRSLGVHLILATQKPSGTVDDNIRSNSKFRLCLRVQDKQDSNDMLHKPDAAYITQAGRCYLQVGNDEIYELFQSGFSGAVYDEEAGGAKTDIVTMCTLDGKAALTGNRSKIKQKETIKKQWYKMLLTTMVKEQAKTGKAISEIVVDQELQQELCKNVLINLEKQGIEYGSSEYNLSRMKELLQLYLLAVEENKDTLDSQVEFVIQEALRKGKKLPETKDKTQLDAIVEHLAQVAEQNHYDHSFMLWLPVLPGQLYLDELPGYEQASFDEEGWRTDMEWSSISALVGLYDDPVNQSQMPLEINLTKDGHHIICGTVVSGKSTFLQTLLFSLVNRYTPDQLNIYGLDFSGGLLGAFEGLAHVGGIVYENDLEPLSKFFEMIKEIIDDRQRLFQGGNYTQYNQTQNRRIPAVIIAIDQYANFKEKTNNVYEDILIRLSRDGISSGIYLIITSAGFGGAEIQGRIGDNIRTTLCLEMKDKYQYAEALKTLHFEIMPEADIKGRGLVKTGGAILEFQTALAVRAKGDYARTKAIKSICAQMNQEWNGSAARAIPSIPEKPILKEFLKLPGLQKQLQDSKHLPMGYNLKNAAIYGTDLSKIYCYTITGRSRSGKTNLLKVLISTANLKGGNLTVIDFAGGLKQTAEQQEARYIENSRQIFDFFKDLIPEFKERNNLKKELRLQGMEEEEIFEKMAQRQPYFIFIDDLSMFVDQVLHPADGVGDMKGFLETITEKGALHHIYFISCLSVEDISKVAGIPLYENMIRFKSGIHLGGNVSAVQRLFQFAYISYAEQGRNMKPGLGLLPSDGETAVQKVVIPLARR